ncbi:MAG: nitroreductase family protein [Oscillospiraceae bacterium]|nr:nitroreductase family protein [Oscillospiraceae bacterium]
MDFLQLAVERQSCRSFDAGREVEESKLNAVLEAVRLAPSACNGQPYHLTVCTGEYARQAANATMGMGINKFAAQAPVLIVISEDSYVKSAALGAKLKGNDYRSIDIGIAAAYLTAQAHTQGLSSCILGWFDDEKLRSVCGLTKSVRLVIALGYAAPEETLREKKRKAAEQLITWL